LKSQRNRAPPRPFEPCGSDLAKNGKDERAEEWQRQTEFREKWAAQYAVAKNQKLLERPNHLVTDFGSRLLDADAVIDEPEEAPETTGVNPETPTRVKRVYYMGRRPIWLKETHQDWPQGADLLSDGSWWPFEKEAEPQYYIIDFDGYETEGEALRELSRHNRAINRLHKKGGWRKVGDKVFDMPSQSIVTITEVRYIVDEDCGDEGYAIYTVDAPDDPTGDGAFDSGRLESEVCDPDQTLPLEY
jgi:hypothetical protein